MVKCWQNHALTCLSGHLLHFSQNHQTFAVQVKGRPGEVYWLPLQVSQYLSKISCSPYKNEMKTLIHVTRFAQFSQSNARVDPSARDPRDRLHRNYRRIARLKQTLPSKLRQSDPELFPGEKTARFSFADAAKPLTMSFVVRQGLLVAVLYCFANGEVCLVSNFWKSESIFHHNEHILKRVVQVQAELKKRWQLFVSSNHFEVRNCFTDIHPKHLWKCSQKSPGQNTEQSESNEDRGHAPTQAHQLQVAVQSAEDVGCGRSSGLEFYMRKSLSSSDGEITSGETMEEIIEESEFWNLSWWIFSINM